MQTQRGIDTGQASSGQRGLAMRGRPAARQVVYEGVEAGICKAGWQAGSAQGAMQALPMPAWPCRGSQEMSPLCTSSCAPPCSTSAASLAVVARDASICMRGTGTASPAGSAAAQAAGVPGNEEQGSTC